MDNLKRNRSEHTGMLECIFPSPPVKGSKLLEPITTWPGIFHEAKVTGIIFDDFWHDSIEDGVAYFFRWLGEPRSTVLVIWDVEGPTHVECRKKGDIPVSTEESERIMAEVTLLFRKAGFWRNQVTH